MMQLICDHCGKGFADVAYTLQPVRSENLQSVAGAYHLHFRCIVAFVRKLTK